MVIETSLFIGLVSVVVVIVGGVIARDRQITNMIHKNHEELTSALNEGDDKLHSRVNELRSHVTDQYVRRTDLDGHLGRIEKGVTELRHEMREERRDTNQRLDAVLQALGTTTKSS